MESSGFGLVEMSIHISQAPFLADEFILYIFDLAKQGKLPSIFFPVEIANIHRAVHGSDSGIYDSEGRFVPSKFEEIFTKHARTHSSALTSDELRVMLKSNREPGDYIGWAASWTEWQMLYYLCKDSKGLLPKGKIHAIYDGSLFKELHKEIESSNEEL
ncbi:hypothetical protein SAY86_005883 [Trapa natans]|uniref:Uncharacterized protein n=1 Tax=Trapa natans TaxID=22666 RepID=A0AAN7L2C2_TRANT|nr:hypothetical protein SAY86_005883 [Trapa natans]